MKGATIKRMAIKTMIFVRKAMPYVLATLSAAGTVAVTVEAVKEIKKNTPEVYYAKQDDVIDDLDKKAEEGVTVCITNNNIDLLKKKIVSGVKTYWKPVTICAGSLLCQFGSVFIFTKHQKKLIIATHQLETLLQRYSQAAGATAAVGGTAVANKLAPTEPPEEPPFDVDNDGKVLFWDPIFNYYFRTTELMFTEAAYQTCVDFCINGYALLSKFYSYMEVSPPVDENKDGYMGWGWFLDDDFKWQDMYEQNSYFLGITYGPPQIMEDGLEYRTVDYFHEPMFDMNGMMLDIYGDDYFDWSAKIARINAKNKNKKEA